MRPSDVLSKYHGESERYLRGVFDKARSLPRAVIFFDGNKNANLYCVIIFHAVW